MSPKHQKQEDSEHSDEDFSNDGEEIDIEEEVINKIKALPTLKDKVICIAINHYVEEKRSLDSQLQKEIELIEQKYRVQFNPFIQEINQIVSGEYEFKDNDFEGTEEILTGQELAGKDAYTKKEKIPEYWLKVFLGSEVLAEQITEADEPLLMHLEKIEAEKSEDLKRFSLYFYFSENEWFTSTKVAKHFDIEQTEIKKAHGDNINWKEGKNITVKTVKKKGKKGGKKTKQVKQPSFFNLFKQVEINSDEEENVAESQNQDDEVEELELQYEMCENIYEEMIPKSLQYYLEIGGDCGDCCGDEACTDAACVKGGDKAENEVVEEEDQDDE